MEKSLFSDERKAAMAWSYVAEGEDTLAVALVEQHGYGEALEMVAFHASNGKEPREKSMSAAMKRWCSRYNEKKFIQNALAKDVGFLIPSDPQWPVSLEYLGNVRPLGLWFRGNPEIISRTSVAIVGSRDSSSYGNDIASNISFALAEEGVAVVSGGALGIDTCAHKGALAADGYTTVVAACGVDRFYPLANTDLFLEIISSGGVICSEYPPGSAPHKHRFLARNRLIAGLTRATVVIEAPYRSGALSTAHHAMNIGRPVGAVPGAVGWPRSVGCHRLLREGATCVTTAQEVKELLGFTSHGGTEPKDYALSEKEKRLQGDREFLSTKIKGTLEGTSTSSYSADVEREVGNNFENRRKSQQELELDIMDPLALRVHDALSITRWIGVEKVAQIAGVTIGEAFAGLGMLEVQGAVENKGARWRINRGA